MADEAARLRTIVESLDRSELVDLLLAAADDDRALRRRLLAREARTGPVDVRALRKGLRAALVPRSFRDYRATATWAREAYGALDVLDELLEAGAAVAGRKLAQDALEMVETAAQRVDDSAGHVTTLADRIGDAHLRACRAAPPPTAELVAWLLQRALEGELDVPDEPVDDYRDLLGDEGLARLRESVLPRFEALPRLGPDDDRGWDTERFRLTRLREQLADDVDELVVVLSHDLSSSYSFLRIAIALRDAGRGDEALRWVQRGQRESTRYDGRLRDLEVALTVDAGQLETAVLMRRQDHERSPTAASYGALRELASQDGTWEAERERARDLLRRAAENAPRGPFPGVGNELVRALLGDDDVEAAWAAAGELPVSPELRLELASRREETAPRDALAVYQELAQEHADQVQARAYRSAASLAARAVALQTELDGPEAARGWAAGLRERNRRRTRLLEELTKAAVP
ncbi:MAG: hypothetical protein M3P95_03970 [Actinomycetota bacterium]|nr:hypothetical protein [Actinomycetota bacterium]